jgi:DNA repair protein RecO (recombination protein O)
MKIYKAEAIILARKNIGEADRLLTLFTKEYGKKMVIAKGIRRITSRRSSHLEIFSHVNLVLHPGKTFDYVSEVTTINKFYLITQKLERIGFVYIALELIAKLTAEHQESSLIFHELLLFLSRLNDVAMTRERAQSTLTSFKQTLLGELGFIHKDQMLTEEKLDRTIEQVLESQLRSPVLLTRIQRNM